MSALALLAGLFAGVGWWALTWSPAARRLRALSADRAPDRRRIRRRAADTGLEAVAAVDRSVELLRAGIPPAGVMQHLAALPGDARLTEALARSGRSLELGDSPHTAIRRHLGGVDAEAAEVLDGMAAVWHVAETAGAPAADMLARYAGTCRERADSARERAVALAGPASTVRVLTWLPLLSLGLAMLIGANPVRLLGSAPGLVSLLGGTALLLAGRAWMRIMLRRAQ
ncbi:hypothetical protein GSY69_04485 [Brevibacterium sp. 5221]|uniref:Type II secretion system protein GspF domain-containing protein n=1 Tax=Brevibacterium rongguiense TaxID=2695267 RepID=A0A6N9H5T3_9MICO|nr:MULTISPECIES: type II secretion system F family protein [Brevibacterium]MYM19245.1 hypothetical protein [Brevibacterium rongguiense]WAL39169.1 type II secretion system F family protein [Brevibacterium sp. BRM-1]